MNNDKLKTTSILSAQRPSGSGKLKLPAKDISTLTSTGKKPFLKEYSLAMESKLQTLKEKIKEKKKQKPKQQSNTNIQKQPTQFQHFLKSKVTTKSSNQIQQKLIISQLEEFLQQVNLFLYKNLLIQNGIDSMEILAEATQKQLEQIGIAKGHALKLKVNVNKWIQSKRPGTSDKGKESQVRETKTKDTDRNKSFVSTSNDKNETSTKKQSHNLNKQIQSICIGTQDDGLESISFMNDGKNSLDIRKNKFCLFCYQSIKMKDKQQFCSQDCEQRYHQMFKFYENNLIKAEQQFGHKYSPQQQEEQQNQQQDYQDDGNFDLLDEKNEFYEDFDYQNYEKIKRQLNGS